MDTSSNGLKMIELQDVSKAYRKGPQVISAVREITLSLPAGTFAALRGPSGCGKSTLLSLVGGLTLPSAGSVRVEGTAWSELSSAGRAAFRAQNIGFVFQLFHLMPYLSVLQNVELAANLDHRGDAKRRATTLLEQLGLADRLRHRPGELSAGERQRTAVARALLNHPKVLLADEPTGNLDPESASRVLATFADFHQQGGTILMVTHDDQAAEHADLVLAMQDGQLQDAPLNAADA